VNRAYILFINTLLSLSLACGTAWAQDTVQVSGTVTSTGTDIGKTFVARGLIQQLRARGRTVEAFKQSLLAAKSVAYPDPAAGHASGIHFRGVLERLGIADQVNAKAKLQKGTFAGSPPEDHGEIGITQPMEILATSGFELAGWLPPELQDYEKFTWAMGVTSNAKEPAAGGGTK